LDKRLNLAFISFLAVFDRFYFHLYKSKNSQDLLGLCGKINSLLLQYLQDNEKFTPKFLPKGD